MNRTKGILAAGTLTGLVIITLLGLGFGNLGALKDNSNNSTTVPQEVIPQEPQVNTTDPVAQEAVKAWQDYSAELEQTIRTMQERENAYRQQIDAANNTIVNLQDQINGSNANAATSGLSGFQEHEHEEHEGFEHDD